MTPKVVERTVKRYFLNGKGYARKSDAYRDIAKSELKEQVEAILYCKDFNAEDDQARFKAWVEAYAELFPLHDPTEATDEELYKWRGRGHSVDSPTRACPFDESVWGYCRQCKREWLKQRTQELMKDVEQRVKELDGEVKP